MHAIIRTGGKQYCVNPNEILRVGKIEMKEGSSLEINEVLMIKNGEKITSGNPFISGAVVKAEILEQKKSKSITVFKKKRRHNYRRTRGHKQQETIIKVIDILLDKKSITSKSIDTKKIKKKTDTKEIKKPSEKPKSPSASKEKKLSKPNKKVTKKE
ncbi:MAG: 50S ribosomal protein L21 [Alphaproteobacteria bacterium MarineAlpha2_Bin1]|nr:MAG: 50S ribosomal protein L21 [Alphaproteobacteria bacterium MarineAlpha2_Bin1]|tara:strand:+ start:1016 stop:1486 length:471 start_codon:yes stop_codon:yes gene_type:complete